MAFKTTSRPVPLPTAAGQTAAPAGRPAKQPLPEGAVRMSRTWLDARGLPQRSPEPVPVDGDDRRTEHARARCPKVRNLNGGGKERCSVAEWLAPGSAKFCPDHGEKLVADKETGRLAAVVSDSFRLFGPSALPWALPGGVLLADGVAATAGMSAAEVALAAPALAGAATWAVARRRFLKEAVKARAVEKGQRRGRKVEAIRRRAARAGLVAAEAGAWSAGLLAAADVSAQMAVVVAAVGMVRWAVGVAPWWKKTDVRRTRGVDLAPPKPEPAAQVAAPDEVALRAVATWATLIGCPGGPLAGTELVDFKRLPSCEVGAATRTRLPNWQAKVVPTVAGSINMREQRPFLPGRIAAAYGCTYADVSFAADESDLGVGWLRVQPDNVLAEARVWSGPDADDWRAGRSVYGRFDDGDPLVYTWWTRSLGAVHDLISGCSGSGKSELIVGLILRSLHSGGLIIDWVADPQGGQSYGAVKDHVDWFARDKTEITLMLLAALKEMQRRNDELARSNVKTWRASKAMPLLVVTLDELQAYIDDPIIGELVVKLVGQGRKCGIKVRAATQIPAAYALGGNTYIKEQLKTGQTITMRAETDQAGRDAVEGDVPINPTELPKVWGKHTCAAGETTAGLLFLQGLTGRDVYGRADWTGEDMLRWIVGADGRPTITPGVFGEAARDYSGALWQDRHVRARRLLEAGRSDRDLLSGGKAIDLIKAASVAEPYVPTAAPSPERPAVAAVADRARDVVLAKAKEVADSRGLVERKRLAEAVKGDMADGTFAKALTDLIGDGDLHRVRSGTNALYSLPGVGDEQPTLGG